MAADDWKNDMSYHSTFTIQVHGHDQIEAEEEAQRVCDTFPPMADCLVRNVRPVLDHPGTWLADVECWWP